MRGEMGDNGQGGAMLREQVKDPRQHLGRDPQAVVTNRHHGLSPFAAGGEPNLSPLFGVLGRVVE